MFNIVNLGEVPDSVTASIAINSNGAVTFNSSHSELVLFDDGRMTILGSLGGPIKSVKAINNANEIVGSGNIGTFHLRPYGETDTDHAFLYRDGRIQDLGTLGGFNSTASGINSHGVIVGSSEVERSDYKNRAFIFTNGKMSDIGVLGKGAKTDSEATGLSSDGSVVGESAGIAFIYSNGRMIELNKQLPPNADWHLISAHAINDRGQVVGLGRRASIKAELPDIGLAYLLSPNKAIVDLWTLAGGGAAMNDLRVVPVAINNRGDVVGSMVEKVLSPSKAFIYRDGKLTDLNTMLPAATGWALEVAWGINDSGRIVGVGKPNSGADSYFLLTPSQ